MDDPRLTFGEMTTYGELARGVHPADEMGLAMALALGQPDAPAPPFATVPVLLNSCPIGQMKRIQYVWGGVHYEFESSSGQTRISSETREAVLQRLAEVLGLTGQPKATMAPSTPSPDQLAARLLYLTRQEKLLKAEKDNVKAACEQLFAANVLAAKTDHRLLFSDSTEHNVRLSRQGTGTYFKVGEQHKAAYDAELKALQQRYIATGAAVMAEKEMTWVAKEVKE